MQIEKIVSRGPETADIIFSNGDKFRISKILIYEKALRKGDDVDEELFGILESLNKKNSIKNRALNLLARRPHAKEELRRKLIRKKFEKDLISEVLSSIEQAGLLNDKEFAILFYNDKLNRGRESKRKILYDLRKRGVSNSVISEVSEMFPEDEENLDEIKKLVERKLKSHSLQKKSRLEIRNRLYQFLLSKGYDFDVIKQIIDELTGEINEGDS